MPFERHNMPKLAVNTRITPVVEQKLAPLAREGKPRQLTILAVRGASGPTGSGSTLAHAAISYLGKRGIPISSKYIGETEKNLALKLQEAERTGNILLFDEADALFGKSTGVRDAHDRYANQEISYLLSAAANRQVTIVLIGSRIARPPDSASHRLRWIDLD